MATGAAPTQGSIANKPAPVAGIQPAGIDRRTNNAQASKT